jgi:hypothetical protein
MLFVICVPLLHWLPVGRFLTSRRTFFTTSYDVVGVVSCKDGEGGLPGRWLRLCGAAGSKQVGPVLLAWGKHMLQ